MGTTIDIDLDPYGELEIISVKNEGDKVKIVHGQDASLVLKANQEDQLRTEEIWGVGNDMKLAARVPFAKWMEWEKLGITKDQNELLRMLDMNPKYKVVKKTLSKGASYGNKRIRIVPHIG